MGLAKKHLEPFAGSEKAEDKRQAAAIEQRIRLLEEMIGTREKEAALPDAVGLEKAKEEAENDIRKARELPEPRRHDPHAPLLVLRLARNPDSHATSRRPGTLARAKG